MAKDLVLNIIMRASDKASGAFAKLSRAARGLSGVLQENQQKLRAVQQTMRQSNAYGDLQRKMQQAAAESDKLTREIKQLTREIAAQGAPTAAQAARMKQLEAASRAAAAKEQKLADESRQLSRELHKAGFDTRNFATEQARLQREAARSTAEISRQKAALDRLENAQKGVSNAKAAAGRWGAAGVAAGAGAVAIKRGLSVPIRDFAEAENAGMDLRVAMMDSSGKVAAAYKDIDALATRLGDRLPGTTADFKNLMTMLIRQGMSAQTILGGTGEAAAYLAVQLRKSPEEAAEMAAKLQDAVRATEGEMLGLVDTVQRMYYAGVEDQNILGAFAKLAPALDIAKIKGQEALKTFGPLIAMLDQAGLSGESAGNALRKVFTRAMNSENVRKALDNAGVGHLKIDFTDGKGEFGGIENFYTQIAKLQQVNTEKRLQILKDIFGDNAETLQALNTMIEKGQAGYNEFATKLQNQASLQQRINATLGTVTNLWDAASGAFTNFMVELGSSIQGEMRTVIGWINDISVGLSNWTKEHPKAANAILKVIAIVGIALAVFAALAAVISAVIVPLAVMKLSWVTLATSSGAAAGKIGLLSRAFTMLGSVFRTLGSLMMANPILIAVVAVVGALYLLYTHWESVKTSLLAGWQKLDMVFADNPILNFIFPIIGLARLLINNWDIIGPFFAQLWQGIKTTFADNPALYAIPFVGWAMYLINNWQKVGPFFAGLWQSIKSFFSGGISGITAQILNWSPLGLFYQAFAAVLRWFGIELPAKLSTAGRNMIQSLINGIKSMLPDLSGVWRQTTNLFNGLSNSARRAPAALGSAVVGRSGQGYSSGGYTGTGGVNQIAGLVHRGEVVFSQADVRRFGGWRAVEALRTGGLRTLQALGGGNQAPTLAAGGTGSVTVNVYAAPGQDERSIARAVAAELDKRQAIAARRANSRYQDKD